MKKENILKKNLDFQEVISKKKQIISRFLIIYYQSYDHFEIGISIPKKFAKAYQRNFIKRQIKWILDTSYDYKKIKKRIVLIVRKEFLSLSIDEKKECIINNLNKIK